MVSAQVRILGGYFVAKLNVLNYLLLSEINLHMDVLGGWTRVILDHVISDNLIQICPEFS